MFTARNDQRPKLVFSSWFDLDSRNCSQNVTENGPNETVPKSQTHVIVGVVASVLVVVVAVALIIICWKMKKCRGEPKKEKEDTEENDTYGTYSRGWDGEGEYGDGDKVYVTDTNGEYYATS